MKFWQSLFNVVLPQLSILLPSIASAGIVNPNQIPSYVAFPKSFYQRPVPPKGWTALTPHGGAFLLGKKPGTVEIASFSMWCDVQGKQQKVPGISLDKIGAGLYLLNPWFGGNDYHESATFTRTSKGTLLFPVPPNRVVHWWVGPRPKIPTGAKNCSVFALMRITGSAVASLGADWWRNQTAQWKGLNVNNQEIGVGNWYNAESKWQVVKMVPSPKP